MSRFRPGDRVCEVPCKPFDEGKTYVVTSLVRGADVATCYLLHPTRGERRLIPFSNLVHFPWPRRAETIEGKGNARLSDFLARRKG